MDRFKSSINLTFILLAVVAAAAVAWVPRLYDRPGPAPFPRQPSEFRSAAQIEQAQAMDRAALEKDPEDITAWTDLAVSSFEQGPERYLEALEALERARDLGALDDRLFYYAAVMYEAKGLLDYAGPEYERFLRHHPDDAETRLRLANLYYRADELDKAIQEYKRVLALRAGDPLVTFNLAMAYRDRGRWGEGLDLLQPLLDQGKPLPPGGYKLLGDLHRGAGDPAQALSHYLTEFSRSKEDPELAAAMARAYEDQKSFAQSLEQWQRVLTLDSNNREAKNKVRLLKRRVAADQKKAGRRK